MVDNQNFLVTGANRGLGKNLLEFYLTKPNHTLIAGVRNVEAASHLSNLPKGEGSKLIIINIDSSSSTAASTAVEELQSKHGITHLDTVIAAAGISKTNPTVLDLDLADLQEHMEVNVYGVIHLYKAVHSLLDKSKSPKFIPLGSNAGSIGLMDKIPFPNSAYGTSKAALNYITHEIHLENKTWTAFPLHPGFVDTDMGSSGAKRLGVEHLLITTRESIDGMVKIVSRIWTRSTYDMNANIAQDRYCD